MKRFIDLKESNCQNCYKCIRSCPVKSISFSDKQAHIIESECILCGQCFIVCPQNAKQVESQVPDIKLAMAKGEAVYVSLAPSYVANYKDLTFQTMEDAFKQLGFAGAGETALGATIVTEQYDQMVDQANGNVFISSCCHSVNLLVQKHFPECLPNLAQVLSPMQAHCQMLKAEHPGARTVFVGPCIAKKEEAGRYDGIVDWAITFEELSAWLEEENITLHNKPDDRRKGKARLYPTTGGILATMQKRRDDFHYLAIDGVENCIHALEDIRRGKVKNCFIEMSACVGSCINGPVMDREHINTIEDITIVKNFASDEPFELKPIQRVPLKKGMGRLSIHRDYPSEDVITSILFQMGKRTKEDELNCGSCGYNSCREKAIAVYRGKADLTMCLPFLKEKAESFSDNIIRNTPNAVFVLNEQLEFQQANDAALKLFNSPDLDDLAGTPVSHLIDPRPYVNALDGSDVFNELRYLPEFDRYVQETIIYDKNYHILMSIMRDFTKEQRERDAKQEIARQTAEITDHVIQKQMKIVQEIASLLGETTAETRVALMNLQESLQDD